MKKQTIAKAKYNRRYIRIYKEDGTIYLETAHDLLTLGTPAKACALAVGVAISPLLLLGLANVAYILLSYYC